MANRVALIGTAKGLVVYDFPEESDPLLRTVFFAGFSANMVFIDHRTNRWWVGLSHKHWGQKLHFSDDEGVSWQEVTMPSLRGYTLPGGQSAKLRQVWCMAEAGKDRPGELWLGTDPGGLFYSKDHGHSFTLVESLWNHSSRRKEGQWFGAGSDYPFIHSIVVNPNDADHVYIAVSCAGVFETKDGGISWDPCNKGLKAAYLPNPNVEVGHDPHLLLMSPKDSNVLWQQNHCGIYHSTNGGQDWVDSSGNDGMPYYGFGIAIDEEDPAKAWVIPVDSDEQRIAPGLNLQVYYTDNYGRKWVSDDEGLPNAHCFDIVLRHSFCQRNGLFLFGTTNGNIYFRNGIKSKWSLLNAHLTKVNSVILF